MGWRFQMNSHLDKAVATDVCRCDTPLASAETDMQGPQGPKMPKNAHTQAHTAMAMLCEAEHIVAFN
eukprot:CAMPEP_0174371050 /NCGR_PEP_ID=MMETSP0811_2-20130205/98322_1 /TAXON_ID=73025 ORGANISM="Eutreptiella gymnastica-like, Strain CCMP1594" /NCGR_SAMPLE_ID=MMETSP0811_2 /ASSEMBLY_ACC=CAM_ASM_000667 /LENGTH=66 /DNA_ID=CAMNT_0015517053 /DNA_START=443 /DNA_END=640 /DNA_ORIENTATION=-